jgi:hypothetical protein
MALYCRKRRIAGGGLWAEDGGRRIERGGLREED